VSGSLVPLELRLPLVILCRPPPPSLKRPRLSDGETANGAAKAMALEWERKKLDPSRALQERMHATRKARMHML